MNDAATNLSIDLPERYQPGHRYNVVVGVGREGMQAAGFQLSIRIAAGERAGAQAGILEEPGDDVNLQVVDTSGVQYVSHVDARDNVSEFRKQWSMTWTAPQSDDLVVFHVVANASNGDDSEFGDYIAADSIFIGPADAKGPTCDEPECDSGGEE
jgi:hypothetical protein